MVGKTEILRVELIDTTKNKLREMARRASEKTFDRLKINGYRIRTKIVKEGNKKYLVFYKQFLTGNATTAA